MLGELFRWVVVWHCWFGGRCLFTPCMVGGGAVVVGEDFRGGFVQPWQRWFGYGVQLVLVDEERFVGDFFGGCWIGPSQCVLVDVLVVRGEDGLEVVLAFYYLFCVCGCIEVHIR